MKPNNKQIKIIDIQEEGVTTFAPAEADVQIVKRDKTAAIKIRDYISPSIMAKLNIQAGVFAKHIIGFRAQIDYVL